MKIFFMRHGEGVDDVEDRYGGWGDLSLSEKGKEQVKDSVEKVKKFNVDLVLSSPLKRAMETAEILANNLQLTVEKWLYLKERNTYGLMCGEKKEDIKKEYPELHEAYENGEWVAGSESYEDLVKRLKLAVKKIQEFDAERILAVTHGKFLAGFVKEFLGKEIDKKEDYCTLEVEIDGDDIKFISADGLSFKE
jgi:broad specificity phosphatase PhoE